MYVVHETKLEAKPSGYSKPGWMNIWLDWLETGFLLTE